MRGLFTSRNSVSGCGGTSRPPHRRKILAYRSHAYLRPDSAATGPAPHAGIDLAESHELLDRSTLPTDRLKEP